MVCVADALIVPVALPGGAFVFHTALFHDSAGVGVVGIMAGGYPVHAHFLEKVLDHSRQSLGHDPPVPPVSADAVADFSLADILPLAHHADGANWRSKLLQHDHPLIEIRLLIFFAPKIQKNKAENLVYETEKALKELEGKVSEEEKAEVEAAKEALQSALNANNAEDIKAKMEALTEKFHALSTKLYEQAAAAQQAAGGAGFDPNMAGGMGGAGFNPNMGGFNPNMGGAGFNPGANNGPQGDVVDADYEVVDNE